MKKQLDVHLIRLVHDGLHNLSIPRLLPAENKLLRVLYNALIPRRNALIPGHVVIIV